jgi:hypothetical protein
MFPQQMSGPDPAIFYGSLGMMYWERGVLRPGTVPATPEHK